MMAISRVFYLFLFIGIMLTLHLSRYVSRGNIYNTVTQTHIYKNIVQIKTQISKSTSHVLSTSGYLDVDSESISKNVLSTLSSYYQLKEIVNLNQTASNLTSSWKQQENRSNYSLGESIKVSIVLYDGLGRPLISGGDFLRIWAVNPSLNANVAGYIIDNGNGSYTGVIKALWYGKMEIRLSLATTKEHVGVFLNKVSQYGLSVPFWASFSRTINDKEEVECTRCSTIPDIRGSQQICNFTRTNFNMSWYCGKPTHQYLNCEHWKYYGKNPPEIFTELELQLMQTWWGKYDSRDLFSKAPKLIEGKLYINVNRQHKHMRFRKSITVNVHGKTERLFEKTISCLDRPPNETWHDTIPTGYMYNNRWYSLSCTNKMLRTRAAYIKCLTNRSIYFLGDSTTRAWLTYLKSFLNLKEIKDAGGKNIRTERLDLNISLSWAPHEFPFYGSAKSNRFKISSVASHLDEIPTNSKGVVVLHWYLHLGRASHNIYRQHIQNAKQSIKRLTERSPNIKIFIKGPHSVQYWYHIEPHDYVKKYQQQILYEEFQDLQEKIIYLDEWDMTVGIENVNIHPHVSVDREMVHTLMSYVCPAEEE